MPDWLPDWKTTTTLLATMAAILAWVAKLRWSKEYAAAKDETIKAKEAQLVALQAQTEETIKTKDAHLQILTGQLEHLKYLTPMKLQEYVKSIVELYETAIQKLRDKYEGRIRDAKVGRVISVEVVDKLDFADSLVAFKSEAQAKATQTTDMITASLGVPLRGLPQCPECHKFLAEGGNYCPDCKISFASFEGFFEKCPKCDKLLEKGANCCPDCKMGFFRLGPE